MKEEIKNLKVQDKRKGKIKANYSWIRIVIIITFIMSIIMSLISELVLPKTNIIIGIILLLIFVFIGVIFDMIGVSVTTADIKVFNSMSARKVKGARLAVTFKQNADKVSSFCNDVIGDVCGVVSGSAGIIVANLISSYLNINNLITTLIVTSVVAALTIGLKALGKTIAINKSNMILYEFVKIVSIVYKK